MIDSVPFTLKWNGNTNSNKRTPTAYQRLAVAVKNLLSVSRIKIPIKPAMMKKYELPAIIRFEGQEGRDDGRFFFLVVGGCEYGRDANSHK